MIQGPSALTERYGGRFFVVFIDIKSCFDEASARSIQVSLMQIQSQVIREPRHSIEKERGKSLLRPLPMLPCLPRAEYCAPMGVKLTSKVSISQFEVPTGVSAI